MADMEKKEATGKDGLTMGRLWRQALPEVWTYQLLAAILILAPAGVLNALMNRVAMTSGGAITTANLKTFLLSWRFPVILLLGFLLVSVYVVFELFSQIHECHDILTGREAGIRRELRAGFRSLRRFLNPSGISVLVFIFLAVPLCGIGFSISLTKDFYIPNFIMDVVKAKPLYAIGYGAGIVALVWIGYHSIFVLHAVLIDGLTPKEGKKRSAELLKKNRKTFIVWVIRDLVIMGLAIGCAYVLFRILPRLAVEAMGEGMPRGYVLNLFETGFEGFGEQDAEVVGWRALCALVTLMGTFLMGTVVMLAGSWFLLRFTRCYLSFSGKLLSSEGASSSGGSLSSERQSATGHLLPSGEELWPERPKKARYRWKIILIAAVFIGLGALSAGIGLFYNQLFDREEPVRIVAHRTGGKLASENSLEGLLEAISHGCYGSETDVQRTSDGYYVINHDNDFKRLTGVARAPKDMTLAEVQELRIRDTTGSGAELAVPTIEEMLDIIKGKEKLFIELKGVTADEQMADDLVRIVQERDCVDDVVMISLNYSVINYIETNWPEFETGTLFFGGIGNVSGLNCDLLIMEEEMATGMRITQIHNAGKEAIVWTVNTEASMRRFLDSEADGIITDEILLAQQVQEALDSRTDLEVIEDKLERILGG